MNSNKIAAVPGIGKKIAALWGDPLGNRPSGSPGFLLAGCFSRQYLIFRQLIKASGDKVGNGPRRPLVVFLYFPGCLPLANEDICQF